MKKIAVVNVGNRGVLLSVIGSNKILDETKISELDQNNLETVNDFFTRNKRIDVYIVLDTVAQNYNYKIFPPLNYFDLVKIANRRFENEIPKNDLKYKKYLYKNKVDKKSTFLFVSASTDSPLKEWLSYFDISKSNLLGVYMVPLETVDFAKKLLLSIGLNNVVKVKNRWILITYNNSVSDLRQVVIYNNNLAFTRLISLESAGPNLGEFAKNDITRTSEYIRRFDPDFVFEKLTIINILDEENKQKLMDLKVEDARVLNFTPFEVANLLKLDTETITENEKYLDLILNLFIFKNKKRIRLSNKKINAIYYLNSVSNILKKFSFLFLFIVVISVFLFMFINLKNHNKIKKLNKDIKDNEIILQNKSKEEFGMDPKKVDKIIDAGSIRDIIIQKSFDPLKSFEKLSKSLGNSGLVYYLKWNINNFNYQSIKDNSTAKTVYNMSLLNIDGNPNGIISKYNDLNSRLKDIFRNELTFITKFNTKLNFNKKYYTHPITIETMEKKQ